MLATVALFHAGGFATRILQDDPGGSSGEGGDSVGVDDVVSGVTGCDEEPGSWCTRVKEWTGSDLAADATDFVVNNLLRIALIVVLAAVASFVAKRLIHRAMGRVGRSAVAVREQVGASGEVSDRERIAREQRALRLQQRTDTLGKVLVSISRLFIWAIALVLVLGELGVNLAPLLAGAGVVGVALGFGSQKVVADFLSGMFMISEDQYGVGDIIDLGEASGTVERITLRTTVLRDVYGTLWHVPNGEVVRVGNKSQHWSMALLDVGVAYDTDVDRAAEVLLETAREMAEDEAWSDWFLDDPEVLGIEELAADAVTLRVSVRVRPAKQFQVQRELNRRFKRALDEAGVEIPFPQRTVWVRTDGPGPEPVPAATAAEPEAGPGVLPDGPRPGVDPYDPDLDGPADEGGDGGAEGDDA